MTFFGVVGILLGLLAIPIAFRHVTRLSLSLIIAAYLLHLLASIAYYTRSLTYIGDTFGYFYDPQGAAEEGFGFGTQFIFFVVQGLKDLFNGTYLDFFLVFQWIGFIGIALIVRIVQDLFREAGSEPPAYVFGILFIPSLHYWSSAFGKDSPFLLAVVLAAWASMSLFRRLPVFAGALFLMLLIRPHIAIVAALALAMTMLLGRGVSWLVRVGVALLAVIGLWLSISIFQDSYNIDVTSSASIAEQFERIDAVLLTEDAGSTAVDANFAIRLVSLLVRPMFYDAEEAFAYVASVESVGILAMLIFMLWNVRHMYGLFVSSVGVRFCIIFSGGMIIFLALSYYNVGLGLRQKWTMLMPTMLLALGALLALKKGISENIGAPLPTAGDGPRRAVAPARTRATASPAQ